MIELMKKEKIDDRAHRGGLPRRSCSRRSATRPRAKVYIISHVAVGAYSADEFETVMSKNADTLVKALVTDPT